MIVPIWMAWAYNVLIATFLLWGLMQVLKQKRYGTSLFFGSMLCFVVACLIIAACTSHPKPLKPVVFTPDTSLDTCGILDHSKIPEIIKK